MTSYSLNNLAAVLNNIMFWEAPSHKQHPPSKIPGFSVLSLLFRSNERESKGTIIFTYPRRLPTS